MPKVKEETVTYKKIADAFKTTAETLRQWKKSDDPRLRRRYRAFLNDYNNYLIENKES